MSEYDTNADPLDPDRAAARMAELEAALVERDRMLRLAFDDNEWTTGDFTVGLADRKHTDAGYANWLADLRARAEEGSDTCPPMSAR